MSSRMRRPETVRLEISRGDWLIVKKHLTAGESRGMLGNMLRLGARLSDTAVDPTKVGLSRIVAYLLDWSITDADDKPVVIREQPFDVVAAAVDNLEPEAFAEILAVIEAHETAMEEERQKNPHGESAPSAISPSAA